MRIHFLSRGPMGQISGGYIYNRYVVRHLREVGLDVVYHPSVPDPEVFDREDVVVVDSLTLPGAAVRLSATRAQVVLLLHVLPGSRNRGTGACESLADLYTRSRVVVTGDATLRALRVGPGRRPVDVVKIEPGVPAHWRVKDRYAPRARHLLGVANYLPGKGIERMIRALSELRDLPWALTVRGNPHFDPGHYHSMKALVGGLGLTRRVALEGTVAHEEVNGEMIRADLLVHFSKSESYSMATAEAIACGLPVLSYRTGDVASFCRSGLVRHVSEGAEVDALRDLIQRPGDYAGLRRVGRRRVRTWSDVGEAFVDWLGARA